MICGLWAGGVYGADTDHLLKQLLEQNRIVREVFGHENHAADYTESGDVSRRQNLMRSVAPEVEAIE